MINASDISALGSPRTGGIKGQTGGRLRPVNIRRRPSVGLLLGQRRRRWTNSKTNVGPTFHVCWADTVAAAILGREKILKLRPQFDYLERFLFEIGMQLSVIVHDCID